MAAGTKTSRQNIRVSPADDVLLREAAAIVGESVEEFLVESGRGRAEMVLADRTHFVLDHDAWIAFSATLDRDAEIHPAVVELLRRTRPGSTYINWACSDRVAVVTPGPGTRIAPGYCRPRPMVVL